MDDQRSRALRQCQNFLRMGSIFTKILPSLHKDTGGFLNSKDLDRITAKEKEGGEARMAELFDILLTKTNEDFDSFCTIVARIDLKLANGLREAAELGLHRSSSSRTSLGQQWSVEEEGQKQKGASVAFDEGQPDVITAGQPKNQSLILPHGVGEAKVGCGEEDSDGSLSGSDKQSRLERNFDARTGEHLVLVSTWDKLNSAVVCIRPHGDLKEGTGTAFVVDIGGTWVVMSAMHCFLKDKKKVRSQCPMFRDHILDYYYWFLYKAEDQYVQLRGNEFIADNVKVEYSVEQDVISFAVEKAKIEELLANAKHYQKIHPIKLAGIKFASIPPVKNPDNWWQKRIAVVFGHPSGNPLSRSSGFIVKHVNSKSGPERIAYQARTEQGSSGSPVFVTFGDNQPIIVAIHHKSGDAHDAWNYGTLLWPYIEKRYYQKDEPEQLVRTIKNNAGIPVTEVVGSGSLTPTLGRTPGTPAQSGGELGPTRHNPPPSCTPTSHPPEALSGRLGAKLKRKVLNMVGLSPGDAKELEVDGEEAIYGPPSCSNIRPEMKFPVKAGVHLVQEGIWDELKSAVVCIRPNGDLDKKASTAFVAKTPDGWCILLSALHCFLEDEEEEDVEEVGGVAIEEGLARPRLASKKEKEKNNEIKLQLNEPAELARRIDESHEGLLRDRILRYCYWFCYKERGQYVELRGGDFTAEHIRVEYNVRSNIISFPVEIAKIEAELAERGQRIHPIELDKVKGASYPQRKSKSFWNKRTATAYGFPLGRPLSRSGGRIVEYVKATGTKTERIGYQVRAEGGSSGGPVFVTFGDDNPVVVAIHSESGKPEDARNYGTLLWPFLQEQIFRKIR